VDLEISGADISPTALTVATRNARAAKANVKFFHLDIARAEIPDGYDILTCSLFLHHLEREPARALLCRLSQAARHLVLVNDLRRCRLGFLLAWAGARVLTTSGVVHADAPRSVAAAFTVEEVRALARDAGLAGARITRRWPFRYLLEWRRP
jgi:2-polyprenyl-3-methyl-5-hydroxy-6-metoxy-1,4-benzoquinol methylase